MARVSPVLIVEDDPDIRETIAQVLEEEGYPSEVASNGKEALAKLSENARFGLILLDLMMPVMDGWQFRAAMQRDPNMSGIPVVVISADGDVQRKASSIKASGYVRKPVAIHQLLAVVEHYCKAKAENGAAVP